MRRIAPFALSLALAASAAPALALEPLSAERYVNDRLVAARVADRIRRACPNIDARMMKAFAEARALERYALAKGYTKAQIDAFLDSKAERARIYALAEDYMSERGAKEGSPDSICRLGRAEIAAGTIAGGLLVAR